MTYLSQLILQKSISRSQFFSLALTIVLLMAPQTIPAKAQQPWSTPDSNKAPTAGGLSTLSPAQRLSIVGVIESTTGGFKFPGGKTQTKAGGGEQSIGEFDNLPTAIASIGSAQTTLVINSVATVSSNVTVPSTINLRFTGAGSLSVSSGVTLSIADGNSIKAGPQQIFSQWYRYSAIYQISRRDLSRMVGSQRRRRRPGQAPLRQRYRQLGCVQCDDRFS